MACGYEYSNYTGIITDFYFMCVVNQLTLPDINGPNQTSFIKKSYAASAEVSGHLNFSLPVRIEISVCCKLKIKIIDSYKHSCKHFFIQ